MSYRSTPLLVTADATTRLRQGFACSNGAPARLRLQLSASFMMHIRTVEHTIGKELAVV
jgi:hypothetical protein